MILDDLVDRAADVAAGEHSYLDYYAGDGEAGERLAAIVADADAAMPGLPTPTATPRSWPASSPTTRRRSTMPTPGRAISARLLAAAPPAAAPLASVLRRSFR